MKKDLQKILVDYSRKNFSDASSEGEEEKEEEEEYDGWIHRDFNMEIFEIQTS